MGLPGIIAILAANNASSMARNASVSARPSRGYVSSTTPHPNKYGAEYREQIIRSVINRARPRWWRMFNWLNICPLNDAAPILNIEMNGNDAYRLLSSFHCVSYWKIPRQIRRRIPELIREALS